MAFMSDDIEKFFMENIHMNQYVEFNYHKKGKVFLKTGYPQDLFHQMNH